MVRQLPVAETALMLFLVAVLLLWTLLSLPAGLVLGRALAPVERSARR